MPSSFENVIVYYDNGQKEITNIINTVFNVFLDAELCKVSPSEFFRLRTWFAHAQG